MNILLNGRKIRLTPTQAIGKGGEADVYSLGNGRALKIFKGPDHPDFQGQIDQQKSALDRLTLHQKKLPAFPSGLPARVITPDALAMDSLGTLIVGYEMKLIDQADLLARYSDRSFRLHGPDSNTVAPIFLDLHQTLQGLHREKVVIGDFNDLNVLVRGGEAWVIDADSFQFRNFGCPVFTLRFLDPLISEAVQEVMIPVKPFSAGTDWFSFNVMLMECLLFVNPFGGVYRPKDPKKRLPHELRPMERVTVFHPEVRYPKSSLPFEALPDQLLQHFHRVFDKDERNPFPENLLKELFWSRCATCGFEHARSSCPKCLAAAPIRTRESIIVRGSVSARAIFSTRGRILATRLENGTLAWISHEREGFRREDGSVLLHGLPALGMKFDLLGNRTFIGLRDSVVVLERGGEPSRKLRVEACDGVSQFACNSTHLFRLEGGTLFRDDVGSSEPIGQVLPGLSRFWVGPNFGLGFYRAAHLHVGFLFSTKARGINDRVQLPKIPGTLVGANCWFSDSLAWLFLISQDQGRVVHQCVVVRSDGEIVGTLREDDAKTDWLQSLTGKCAVGHSLLAATDSGIVRVEVSTGGIQETRRFPDTENFVHEGCSLLPAREGLYVADTQEIRLLGMS